MDEYDSYDGTDRFGTDSFGMEKFFDRMRRTMMSPLALDDRNRSRSDAMGRRNANLTVERTEEGFVVIADIPGFETDDIDLRFKDGMLTIDAEHDVETEEDGVTSRRRRSVQEHLRVPGDVDEDRIEASYRNGVLEIDLPLLGASDDESTRISID